MMKYVIEYCKGKCNTGYPVAQSGRKSQDRVEKKIFYQQTKLKKIRHEQRKSLPLWSMTNTIKSNLV